jgi:AhpD family alkylhydroperoxidase
MRKRTPALLVAVTFFAPWLVHAEYSLQELNRAARQRVGATARLPLSASLPADAVALEEAGSGRTPNYLRAFALAPSAAAPFAQLLRSVLQDGALEPETKMAMGLRIAQSYGSPYIAVHMQRFLRGSQSGRELLGAIEKGAFESLSPERRLSLRYAEDLNGGVLGVSDAQFRETRAYFSDSQVVELTLTVCFFNYFTRLAEGMHLPVEPWALDSEWTAPASAYTAPPARVHLISNGEMQWAAVQVPSAGDPPRGLPNSMRAMYHSPEIAAAWRAYGGATRRDSAVDRELLLHVSFAVSMANGCRYCTLHQVQGLHRLGVKPAKLMQMKKDDSALTPRELTAVLFARKLTADPISVTDADFAKLKEQFGGDRGAFDILLQTSTFAFMNRFTDGLRLPSEDEAVRIYRETYGQDFERTASP